MTCRSCGASFCWLCRGSWRSGCKNKLCKPNHWLDQRLGRSAPFVKPPIVLVAAPVALGLGVVVGGVAVAAAGAAATLAVPYFMVRIPCKLWQEAAQKRERERVRATYFARLHAQNGVGITFVGAEEGFANFVHYSMSGRTIEVSVRGNRVD
jgi:hypothetical protein